MRTQCHCKQCKGARVCVCVCGGGGWGGGGLPTSVGVNLGSGEARDGLGCPAHYRLQVGCHLAGVNKFSCGTEEAPALVVPQRQPSDVQGSPKLIKLWWLWRSGPSTLCSQIGRGGRSSLLHIHKAWVHTYTWREPVWPSGKALGW